MPLSISSSDRAHNGRAIGTLLAATAVLCLCVEAAATLGLERISRIHQRIIGEQRNVRTLTPALTGRPKTMLLVGNSLLLDGVDMTALGAGLAGQEKPARFVVESTGYYDWFYGLRRLFREGMRPDSVILCMTVGQLAGNGIRGDFSAHFLFDWQDLWPVSRAAGADLTTTSSYYAAHLSTFYAARSELRAVVMGKISPAVPAMWQVSVPRPGALPPDDQLFPVIVKRMRDLSQLCAGYGAQFMLLVPPLPAPGDQGVIRAGAVARVRVVMPIPNGSLPLSFYKSDGFHLNREGAAAFTDGAIRELPR